MPGPIWIERLTEGFGATFMAYLGTGNTVHRTRRVQSILARMKAGTWVYRQCGGPLHVDTRADSVFFSEDCKKRAARQRRG